MQRTRNRKSVLGENPFDVPSSASREPSPAGGSPSATSPKAHRALEGTTRSRAAKGKQANHRKAKVSKVAAKRSTPPAPVAAARKRAEAQPDAPDKTLDAAAELLADDASASERADAQAAAELVRKRAVEAKIRDLESRPEPPAGDGDVAAQDVGKRAAAAAKEAGRHADGGVLDTAKEMLSSDYYLRQWGRIGMRNRSEVVDEFGYDPTYDARVRPVLELLYSRYFRAVTEGIEHVPATGRALIVVNHSGTFPYDGVMLKTAVRKEHPSARDLRWLSEDQVFYLPFVGSFVNRLGSVRACQENAERLLAQDNLVAVFPEGAKGMGRLYRDRYRLQRFGRGGFIRLCLRTRTPIVPCVIVGAEESMPLMMRIEYLTGPLGLPYLPITPTFPLLGPLGLLPAPTRWSFMFGPPIQLEGYGPESADDNVLVGRLTERVRATMQTMIDRAVAARRSVWFG